MSSLQTFKNKRISSDFFGQHSWKHLFSTTDESCFADVFCLLGFSSKMLILSGTWWSVSSLVWRWILRQKSSSLNTSENVISIINRQCYACSFCGNWWRSKGLPTSCLLFCLEKLDKNWIGNVYSENPVCVLTFLRPDLGKSWAEWVRIWLFYCHFMAFPCCAWSPQLTSVKLLNMPFIKEWWPAFTDLIWVAIRNSYCYCHLDKGNGDRTNCFWG